VKVKSGRFAGSSVVLALKQSLVILAISGLLFLLVDTTFGLLGKPKPYATHRERLTSPSYEGEPYFSERFLVESFTQPGGWLTPEGTRLVLPREFHGEYFNVDVLAPTGLTYRRTVQGDARGTVPTTILLLGGSTIYNSEVPDELTVASQLSSVLSGWSGRSFVVINAGVTSASSVQEIERLGYELKNGLRPDVVVSYGGVNDVLQGTYFGNPDGVMFEGSMRPSQATEDGAKGRVIRLIPEGVLRVYRAARSLVSGTHIFRALVIRRKSEGASRSPGHLGDGMAVKELVRRTRDRYVESMLEGEQIARRNGFRFVSVLQPHLYSAPYADGLPDLELAREAENRRMPGVELAFTSAYPSLREAVGQLRGRGVSAYDCSRLLLARTSNIFLDSHHVNSNGDRLIACALATILAEGEGGPTSGSEAWLEGCRDLMGNRPACGDHDP
jgi:hypothetical protein